MACYSCLHPVTIHNSRGTFRVPCGKCEACLNRKGSSMAMQCDIEEQKHKFCYFITLTYSDDNLPVCQVIKHNRKYVFLDVSKRDCIGNLSLDGDSPVMAVADDTVFSDGFFGLYYSKLNLHPEYYGLIPYLSRRDVQLFLKRLRKKQSTYTDEKVRYYACGEYGPVHFRPHYHLLLFFDSQAVADNLREDVLACWRFGRVDIQLSEKRCSGYVSKYVNSISNLSAVQRLKAFRPFSAHSRYFGQSVFEDETKEVREIEYGDFVGHGVVVNGRFKEVFPWLAFEDNLFPKCYRYGSSDSHVRLFLYTAYERVSRELGYDCISRQSVELFHDIYYHRYKYSFVREFCCIFASDLAEVNDQTFLSILYTSNKFFKLCKKFSFTPYALLNVIEHYYSTKELYKLGKQLQEQSDFIAQNGTDFLPFLLSWYSNFDPIKDRDIKEYEALQAEADSFYKQHFFLPEKMQLDLQAKNPYHYPKCIMDYFVSINVSPYFVTDFIVGEKYNIIYRQFASIQKRIYVGSVKHKKLNDLNNMFSYGKYYVNEKCAQQGAQKRL